MAAARPRFAAQRSGKGRWKTVLVDSARSKAEAAFEEMVSANPRGYFRVIQLDPRPDSDSGQREFDWKLLTLYDPKRGRIGTDRRQERSRTSERLSVPVRLYLLAILTGMVFGGALLLAWGPWRSP